MGVLMGVFEGVTVGGTVGINVEVAVDVAVGNAVGSDVCVDVGKSGTMVTPGTGVRVATLGTQSTWPLWMVVEDPIQLARCNC